MFNYGTALLRIVAAFSVVWQHFGNSPIGMYIPAVPVFIVLSFFLSARKLQQGSLQALAGRVSRLLVPYWFWGVLYWILFSVLKRRVSFDILFWQLTLGDSACRPLYFYFILLFLTVLFYFVMRKRGLRMWVAQVGLLVAAVAVQYLGLNSAFVSHCFPEHQYVLGRIVELLPYGVVGIMLAYFCEGFKRGFSRVLLCASLICFVFSFIANALFENPPGFGYQGARIFFCTIGWVALGVSLGRLIEQDHLELPTVRYASSYMMGVYCLHYAVGNALLMVGLQVGWLIVLLDCALSFGISVLLARFTMLRKVVL